MEENNKGLDSKQIDAETIQINKTENEMGNGTDEVVKKKKPTMIWLGLMVLVVLVGTGATYWMKEKEVVISNINKPTEKIKVALKWFHQAQFAGYYVAEQKGYYANQGLDVDLMPFNREQSPIDLVVSGQVDFGVVGASEVIVAREEGKKIKAIGVIYQENPAVAYVLSLSGINSVIDFKGKKVGTESSPDVMIMMDAMLRVNNVDSVVDIERKEVDYEREKLISGEIDVAIGYIINEPTDLKEMGYEVTTFSPSDYGIKTYADVLIATDEMIENQPDLIRRFLAATFEGWEYALDNVDEAVDYTLLYQNINSEPLDFNHQKIMLELSKPLIKPFKTSVVGKMNYTKWFQLFELLKQTELIDNTKSLNIEDVYTTIFNN